MLLDTNLLFQAKKKTMPEWLESTFVKCDVFSLQVATKIKGEKLPSLSSLNNIRFHFAK